MYTANEGSRLEELIEAAGGPTEDADLTAINLALRVSDEDHWHIPRVGEPARNTAAQVSTQSKRIDVNSADETLLITLPGIGEVKAQAIIRHREANGPFASPEDLLAVRGIGPATLEAILDLVDTR